MFCNFPQSFSQTYYAFACLVGFLGNCVNFRSGIHCFIGGIFGFFYFTVDIGRKFGYFIFSGFSRSFSSSCVLLQSIHTGVYCGYVFADCVKLVGNFFAHCCHIVSNLLIVAGNGVFQFIHQLIYGFIPLIQSFIYVFS